MARNIFVYGDAAYEGELALYRAARVGSSRATTYDQVGPSPVYVYRASDAEDALITDDEVAVRRFFSRHPKAEVQILRVVH